MTKIKNGINLFVLYRAAKHILNGVNFLNEFIQMGI